MTQDETTAYLHLYGGDPFADVHNACEPHREARGPDCGVYPAAPPNCFLLEDAITGRPRNDWAQFADPRWAENVQAYARKLVSDSRLHSSFIMRPAWVGLAYKRPDA